MKTDDRFKVYTYLSVNFCLHYTSLQIPCKGLSRAFHNKFKENLNKLVIEQMFYL